MHIRRLIPADAATYQALRLQALRECPAAFGSSYEEECETPITVIAGHLAPESGRNMFGVFNESRLIGTVGVGRESVRKLSHKGFIRGMYVAPAFRRSGVGAQLLKQALAFAESMHGVRQVTLVVNAENTSAVALYQSQGFKSFGVEPAALLVEGVPHDEMHMVRHVPTNPSFEGGALRPTASVRPSSQTLNLMSQLLFTSLEEVVDEETFLAFVEALGADRIAAGRMPVTADGRKGEWANQSIDSFLDAARSWAEDSGFGSRPGPKPQNPWRLFASFLWAGRGYE